MLNVKSHNFFNWPQFLFKKKSWIPNSGFPTSDDHTINNQQSSSPTSAIHHMCSVISHAKPCFHHEDGKESVSEWIWKRERKIEICDVGISTRWWVSEDRGRAGALWILWIWSRSSSWDHDGDLYAKSQWMPNDISTGFWFTMIVKARLYVRIYQGDFFVDDDEKLFRSIFDLCMQSQPTTHHKSPIPQSNWKIPYTTKPQVERYVLMLVTSAPSEKDYDDLPLIGSAVWIAGVYVLLNGLVRSIDETDWWNLQIILSSQKWQLKRGGEWLEILSTCLSDAESLFVRWKGTLARLLARIMNYKLGMCQSLWCRKQGTNICTYFSKVWWPQIFKRSD